MTSIIKKRQIEWYELGQRRCYCGVQLNWTGNRGRNAASFEHLIPKSQGGTRHKQNGIIVCRKCNNDRGNKDWIEWIREKNPPKAEWLIQKYLDAHEFYRTHPIASAIKIKIKIKAPVTINIGTMNVYTNGK